MPNAKFVKPLFRKPTRYPAGVSTVTMGDPKDRLGVPDPSQWNMFFDDFDGQTAALTSASNGWATQVIVGSSTAAPVSDAAAGGGGLMLLTTGAAGTDSVAIARHATLGQNFVLDLTRKLYMECRVAFTTGVATLGDFGFGLVPASKTSLLSSSTDGIRIGKTSAAATMQADFSVGSTTPAKTVTALFGGAVIPVTTPVTLGLAYNGIAYPPGASSPGGTAITTLSYEFVAYCDLNDGNGVRQQAILVTAAQLPANTVGLMPSVSLLATSAAAQAVKLDYVLVAQERFNA